MAVSFIGGRNRRTLDSAALSVYVSVILRVCKIVGFSILFFRWKMVKYATCYPFRRAMISFPRYCEFPKTYKDIVKHILL